MKEAVPVKGKSGSSLSWLGLLTVVVGLGMLILGLLGKRLQRADHYPEYSSLRADPLGTKALLEGLQRMDGYRAERNFQPLKKLEGATGKALLLTGISARSFQRPFVLDSRAIVNFASHGGRVVLAINPAEGSRMERLYDEAMDEAIEDELQEKDDKKEKKPELSALLSASDKPAEKKEKRERLEKKIEELQKNWSEKPPLAELLKTELKGGEFMLTAKGGSEVEPELVLGLDAKQMPLWYSNLYLDDTGSTDFREVWMKEMFDRLEDLQAKQDRREGILRPDAPHKEPKEYKSMEQVRSEASPWVVLARRGGRPVVAERALGSGSVVITTDRFFLSNEALWKQPSTGLISWLLGDARHIIFDETALGGGIGDEDGIMTLARRYRMHGLFLVGLVFMGLYLWRNASSLVPRDESYDLGLWRDEAVAGQGAASGLEGLLRRGLKWRDLLPQCLATWESNPTLTRTVKPERLAAAKELVGSTFTDPKEGEKLAPVLYEQVVQLLSRRG
jgi:hypothetical protein